MPVVDTSLFQTRRSPVTHVEVEPLATPSGFLAATCNPYTTTSHHLGYLVRVLGLPNRSGPPQEQWSYLVIRLADEKFEVLQYAAVGEPGLISPTIVPEGEERIRFILDQVQGWQNHQQAVDRDPLGERMFQSRELERREREGADY